ncbi:hypothetical protein [Paenibacillus sp. DYY-L-2]|uniref:hypothetical protein n=1 Tax=Paenibacillus sp. DYY-L-2 TaxID=3447013 RepID=UPI003F50D065
MKRKKSRSEVWFTLGFLFTLVTAFATFLLGLNMGINRTEAKYLNLKASMLEIETADSYNQQDIVTFYYAVYQPYQQFKEEYAVLNEQLGQKDSKVASAKTLKDVRDEARKQYEQISANSVAGSSPLLKQAQTDILKSLKLFDEGIDRNLSFLNGETGITLIHNLTSDEFTKNAVDFGLKAQNKFYAAILKWSAKLNNGIPESYTFQPETTIKQWQTYSLAQKNKAVSDIMLENKLFTAYQPQDLTAKIDQMINSGKASALKLHSVSSIVKIVTETEAVQSKEFMKWKSTYYASEQLPELPFFTEEY